MLRVFLRFDPISYFMFIQISRVEHIHSRNFIHRDITPDNFLMGVRKRGNMVYIIDFGLSKRFRDPETCLHILFREDKNFIGTTRYASVNAHLGVKQAHRDGLESLAFILIYFLCGSLPWQGLKATSKKKHECIVRDKKMTTSPDNLCHGLPNEFGIFLKYCRALRFDDKPDYAYLRKLFRDLSVREGYKYDNVCDWSIQRSTKDEAGDNAKASAERKRVVQEEEGEPRASDEE